jgi:hypothetical protein
MSSSRSGAYKYDLVNTYQDDTISNGAEISNGLRGFEDWNGGYLRGLIKRCVVAEAIAPTHIVVVTAISGFERTVYPTLRSPVTSARTRRRC